MGGVPYYLKVNDQTTSLTQTFAIEGLKGRVTAMAKVTTLTKHGWTARSRPTPEVTC